MSGNTEKSKITVQEMVKMHIDGKSYDEIAKVSGIAKQNVHKRISRYCRREVFGESCNRWGKKFPVDEIIYKGIYQWFKNNPQETLTSFNRNTININLSTLSKIIKGGKSCFTIQEIIVICNYIGKSFEEVFQVRK